MKSRSILIGLGMFGCFVICAVIFAQVNNNNNQSIPQVEINARFTNADKNGDGVLCKEEFANYFAQIQQVKFTANNSAQSESKSGCCGEEVGNVKVANSKSGEKGCCSEGKKAETVSVKFSKDGEAKAEGCCGNKDKAKNVDAKSGEKGCCSEGKKEASSTNKNEAEVKNNTELKPVAATAEKKS
ncbi:MAG: hypothetical protein LBC74_15985 [Planctomycetaceae bacterium]|jgi:hypothetical protein|nr:hypothetical protein [Planctomycetaceae bacterium]